MLGNSVDTFLLELSEHYGIDFDLEFNAGDLRRVGRKIGIKSVNRIKGWRINGYIPDQSIQKILRLDIPDDLKALALRCRRSITSGPALKALLSQYNLRKIFEEQ